VHVFIDKYVVFLLYVRILFSLHTAIIAVQCTKLSAVKWQIFTFFLLRVVLYHILAGSRDGKKNLDIE